MLYNIPFIIIRADPVSTQSAAASPNSNITKTIMGTQKFIALNDPQSMKKALFLVGEEVTHDKPHRSNYKRTAFLPAALAERELDYEGTFMYHGLQTLKYQYHPTVSPGDEETQRSGEMPYPNMQNLLFTGGAPLIITLPNFYGVDEGIFRQNVTSYGPDGGGVNLYRLHNGYSGDAKVLSFPEEINADTNQKYSDSFTFNFDYAAVTGSGVRANAPVQVNTFSLNCNPQLDPTCGFRTTPVGAGPELCYGITAGVRRHRPCSALNVFTPKIRGERVLPIMWYTSLVDIPEKKLEFFTYVVWLLFASCIGVIVFGVLFFGLFCYWLFSTWKKSRGKGDIAVIAHIEMGEKV